MFKTAIIIIRNLQKSDWSLLLISLAVLFLYSFYTVQFLFFTPYPGFAITSVSGGWQITDSFQPDFQVDDVLIQIGDLTFGAYQKNRLVVPFAGYAPEEFVTLILRSGDQITLQMPQPSLQDRLRRMLFGAWFFPFWLVGTAVLLFIRPRDLSWRLLVALMYVIAIWLVTGTISVWRIAGVRLVLGAAEWLTIPIILHLHLVAPIPIFPRLRRFLIPSLYVLCFVLAILEFWQIPSGNLPLLFQALAILLSLCLLLYRYFRKAALPQERLATRLMLAGIALAFGPSILLIIFPQVLNLNIPSSIGLTISLIALPILPLFYVYAIYKRQLGNLEFRANRLLSMYSFILLYPPLFLVLYLVGSQTINSAGSRTIYFLFISTAFVLATPSLLTRFQKIVNRIAHGTQYNQDDIVRVFADQIPSILQRDKLITLLKQEITVALLIRESALYILKGDSFVCWYHKGFGSEGTEQLTQDQLHQLLLQSGAYRAPNHVAKNIDWVRLALPLTVRDIHIGIWLFGRRDPDDFYPEQDIALLQTLANQTATVIENISLYEALQRQANSLATEVDQRTAELQAERDRTQAILDNAAEGIFFIDNRGFILYMNPRMNQLTGFSDQDMLGKTISIWQIEESKTINGQIWVAITSGQKWSGELTLRRQSKITYDASLTITPLQMAQGQLTGFVGVLSDISKFKEVDRLKSDIIANVSHELRTPLTNITLYHSLLRRAGEGKRQQYLDTLHTETERLTNLIQDLLDLSKLDTGSIQVELEPMHIKPIIDAVIAASQKQADKKHITIQREVPTPLPSAMADVSQIEQVLTNLVGNAINYTPSGGHVNINAGEGQMESLPAIWIRVTDNGYGIVAEDLPHVFERFFRGKTAKDNDVSGTGLGLAICKKIIDHHGGQIKVDSHMGKGTTFEVWLKTTPYL